MSTAPTGGIRFVTAGDGVRLAYLRSGRGPLLVRPAHWLSHLEFDRWSPIWRDFLTDLAADHTLVRYDERGTGLSDRDVADLSFDAMVGDLEALVDALALERFTLLGMSQGGAISIAYAARHPERVRGLVLCGAYARGHSHRQRPAAQRQEADVLLELIRVGWGTPDPKFRHVFADMFLPGASAAQYEAFDQLQRVSATPEIAYRLREMFSTIDVTELCPQVAVPALVMHLRDDGVVPFEEGRLLAALLPNARFVPLDGARHIFQRGEPAYGRFFAELTSFEQSLAQGPTSTLEPGDQALTARERQIMALVSRGMGNAEIAAELYLSPRTIERHLSNVYVKLGLRGKAARAAAAARLSRGT